MALLKTAWAFAISIVLAATASAQHQVVCPGGAFPTGLKDGSVSEGGNP